MKITVDLKDEDHKRLKDYKKARPGKVSLSTIGAEAIVAMLDRAESDARALALAAFKEDLRQKRIKLRAEDERLDNSEGW